MAAFKVLTTCNKFSFLLCMTPGLVAGVRGKPNVGSVSLTPLWEPCTWGFPPTAPSLSIGFRTHHRLPVLIGLPFLYPQLSGLCSVSPLKFPKVGCSPFYLQPKCGLGGCRCSVHLIYHLFPTTSFAYFCQFCTLYGNFCFSIIFNFPLYYLQIFLSFYVGCIFLFHILSFLFVLVWFLSSSPHVSCPLLHSFSPYICLFWVLILFTYIIKVLIFSFIL